MIARRSTIKPFVKVLNFTHIMPTRSGTLECAHSLQLFSYSAEMTNLKDVAITPEGIKDLKARREIRKQVKKVFEAKSVFSHMLSINHLVLGTRLANIAGSSRSFASKCSGSAFSLSKMPGCPQFEAYFPRSFHFSL